MFSRAYKRYALWILTLVYTMNLVDRGLVALLLQPIKEDLRLSDTQLGLMTGIAFGLFYAVFGLPIARWADRGNRVLISSLAIGLWGATVMGHVLVRSYAQLLIARMLAAVGEAGCKPPTYSLVGDYFPGPVERTRAMAVYWLGSPLGLILSFVLGGQLNEMFGWRETFLLMGIPGLVLAVIVRMTIDEPQRQGPSPAAESEHSSLRAVATRLWEQRSCRHLSAAIILVYALSYGLAPWEVAFMIRSHGMATVKVGFWIGMIISIGGTFGLLLGGYVSNRWFAGNERGQLRMGSITAAAVVPCFVVFLTAPGDYQALAALAPFSAAFIFFMAPTFALLQRLMPNDMWATALSVIMFLANLIGMGVGPQIVGVLSDMLRPTFGNDSLRYALLAMSLIGFWAAYHLWRAGIAVGNDSARASIPT